MTTTLFDHESQLLGRLGASEQGQYDDETFEALIFEGIERLRGCGATHDAFAMCRYCESVRAEIIQLRKEQRMAAGDHVGAQRLMR